MRRRISCRRFTPLWQAHPARRRQRLRPRCRVNYTGGDSWTKSLKVLRVGGRLLTCGATAGFDPPEDIRYIWTFELQILGSNGWAREDVTMLLEMIEAGRLTAVIDETLPLERAAEGLLRLEKRQVFGKLVVTP
jgi:alcohol dehydrogenase